MKILIIGGVAGGAAAAARSRRLDEKAQIIIFEKGQYISYANCGLPYYAGDVIKDRSELLLQTPENFSKIFKVDVRIQNEVLFIDRKNNRILVKDLSTGKEHHETYDKLIVSPGARPIRPDFEGSDLENVFTVRTIPDIDRIKNMLDNNVKNAVVIGGGFIGIEMAENIKKRHIKTHLIEKLDQVMPNFDKDMAVILHRELAYSGVNLHLNDEVTKISRSNNEYFVQTKSGKKISCNIVIMAIGVIPETKLLKDAEITIGNKGVAVNNKMQTSDKNIYAVGDVVETINPITKKPWHIPLAWPAARQAIVAVNNIFGIDDEFSGTYGTSVVKVFNLTAASTGASEKMLQSANIKYSKIYTHPYSHAAYYPGASQMSIKVLYDPETETVLGAQAIGSDGVDKRVNVLAVSIKHKLKVSDLAEMEFCYSPPFGSAKDAVNFIGMTAQNSIRGLEILTHWEYITENDFLLDVRTPSEFKKGSVPGAINIPLDELRFRLNEIPENKKIAVFCQVGIRAHNASRFLVQSGYRAINISGGYLTYINFNESRSEKNLNYSDDF